MRQRGCVWSGSSARSRLMVQKTSNAGGGQSRAGPSPLRQITPIAKETRSGGTRGDLAEPLCSNRQVVLDAQPVAHGAKRAIIGHKHVVAGEKVRFNVPAILGARTRTLVRLPAGRDGVPRVVEARHDVAGKQVLGWKSHIREPRDLRQFDDAWFRQQRLDVPG